MSLEGPLPTVPEDQFAKALQKTRRIASLPNFAKDHSLFVQATTAPNNPFFKEIKGMRSAFVALENEAEDIHIKLDPDKSTKAEILYGAALMFVLLDALGHPFMRPLSKAVVTAYFSSYSTHLISVLNNLEGIDPNDIDRTLNVIDTTDTNLEYVPFTHRDLYEENPAFEAWMEDMNSDQRLGATRLYGLFRRQASTDALNQLWGE